MAMTKWGRNETFIWPPHSPIYTYGTVFMAVILTGLFVYCRFTFGNGPLQRIDWVSVPDCTVSSEGSACRSGHHFQRLSLTKRSGK
jgi:hypothetical protein